MRLRDVSAAQQRLLADLASGISGRLEVHFVELPNQGDAQIGVAMREGSKSVVIELGIDLLAQAMEDPAGREVLRTRMKSRRDRMMFQPPPARLPKKIAPLFDSAPSRGGFRGGRR